MATIVTKLTDDRPLGQILAQLMDDIQFYDNMISSEPEEDRADLEDKYRSQIEGICLQIGLVETVMSLKCDVDCDCFYTDKDRQ